MVEILEKLQYYLQFPFVIYAFIVGVLIALCSSLLGVTLVLKRFSYIGDGLSHVAFGAMAVASVIGLTDKVFSILVMVFFVLFYNRLFAVTFDENFSKATGVKTDRYNLLIAIIIAVIIVLGMNLVGSLLISALIIFPALSAMRIIKNFKGVVIFSASLSVICAVIGMLVSILASTPVGSTIVAADMTAFLICAIIGKIRG